MKKKELFSNIKYFFRENEWDINLIIFITIAFLCNIFGFKIMFEENNLHGHLQDYIYLSIRIFVFDLQTPDIDTSIPWLLEIGRWLSALATVYAVILTIKHIFKDKWNLYKKGNEHIIIVGAGDKGKTLGLDWIKNIKNSLHEDYGKLIVFIEKNKNNSNIDILKDAEALIIFGDATDKQILVKAKIHTAKYFVILTNNDATNIEVVSKVTNILNEKNTEETKLNCFIHLLHNEFYDFFMTKDFFYSKKIDIKIFNVNSNSARMLFSDEKYLLGSNVFINEEKIKNVKTKVKIAIFNFDNLGENILLHALNIGHFYNNNPIEVTVVFDKDKNENKNLLDEFEKQYDILNKDYNGKYWNVKFIDDGDFRNENICEYSQIIIAYENEFESLSNLMKLLKKYNNEILTNNIDIAIYSNSFISTAKIIQNDKEIFKQVRTFGEISETCNYKQVINQELDKMAILNNKLYNELHGYDNKNKTAQEEWLSLNMFLKDSNRYLMEHNQIKDYLISKLIQNRDVINDYENIKNKIVEYFFTYENMKKINWDNMGLKNHDYILKLSFEEIVQLGKVEHTRWNAFHILNGWKKLDIPKNSSKQIYKDRIKKLHPCIVSWDELDEISKNHNHDYKSDDIETIMRIPILEKLLKDKL